MSAEEFWKCDPQLFISYRNAFINRKKRELEENDYKSWLTGLYTHDGNTKLFASLKQFIANLVASFVKGKKDNTKIEEYPSKPYSQLEKEREENEAKEEKDRKKKYEEYEDSLRYYGTMKQRYLEGLKEKQKKGK